MPQEASQGSGGVALKDTQAPSSKTMPSMAGRSHSKVSGGQAGLLWGRKDPGMGSWGQILGESLEVAEGWSCALALPCQGSPVSCHPESPGLAATFS